MRTRAITDLATLYGLHLDYWDASGHAPSPRAMMRSWPCSPRSGRRSRRSPISQTPRASAGARLEPARRPGRRGPSPASTPDPGCVYPHGQRAPDTRRSRSRTEASAASRSSWRRNGERPRALDGEARARAADSRFPDPALGLPRGCASRPAATPPPMCWWSPRHDRRRGPRAPASGRLPYRYP